MPTARQKREAHDAWMRAPCPPPPPPAAEPEPEPPVLSVVGDAQLEPEDGSNADDAPVPVRHRHDGWTAVRQRLFLTVLAETGSVSEACVKAGVSARSAYRLRARSDAAAFAAGWDEALKIATGRLTALAFERATTGTVRETWRDGELVQQVRAPSDRLLMFLLAHLLPAGRPGERWEGFETMTHAMRAAFPATLDRLQDHALPMVPIETRDFFPAAPGDPREDM